MTSDTVSILIAVISSTAGVAYLLGRVHAELRAAQAQVRQFREDTISEVRQFREDTISEVRQFREEVLNELRRMQLRMDDAIAEMRSFTRDAERRLTRLEEKAS